MRCGVHRTRRPLVHTKPAGDDDRWHARSPLPRAAAEKRVPAMAAASAGQKRYRCGRRGGDGRRFLLAKFWGPGTRSLRPSVRRDGFSDGKRLEFQRLFFSHTPPLPTSPRDMPVSPNGRIDFCPAPPTSAAHWRFPRRTPVPARAAGSRDRRGTFGRSRRSHCIKKPPPHRRGPLAGRRRVVRAPNERPQRFVRWRSSQAGGKFKTDAFRKIRSTDVVLVSYPYFGKERKHFWPLGGYYPTGSRFSAHFF